MFEKNINNTEFDNKGNIGRILKSTLFSIILTLILLFFYSILLTYTNISEGTIPIAIIIISGISILIFSIICMLKIKNKGIFNGGIIGLIYMITIYLISSLIRGDFKLNIYAIIMVIVGIICGMTGGIIGVNIKVKK